MRTLISAFVVSLSAIAFSGCKDGPEPAPPPLQSEVIVNDLKVPAGCKLLVFHAFNECRNGTWHTVTRATYQCGETQVVKEVHAIRTNQPCHVGGVAPSIETFVSTVPPAGCQSPVTLFACVSLACVSGSWNWLSYDMIQCADGSLYLVRVPARDISTTMPCTGPHPRLPGV